MPELVLKHDLVWEDSIEADEDVIEMAGEEFGCYFYCCKESSEIILPPWDVIIITIFEEGSCSF